MSEQTNAMPVIPEPNTQGPVSYGHGVSFEWVEGGRIAVFSLKDSTRASVDTFFRLNLAFAEQNRGKTIYIFNDASSPDISLTPYLRQKTTNLARTLGEYGITAQVASLVQPGFFSTLAKLFGNMLARSGEHITQKFFNDRSEAMDWLKAQLPD